MRFVYSTLQKLFNLDAHARLLSHQTDTNIEVVIAFIGTEHCEIQNERTKVQQ